MANSTNVMLFLRHEPTQLLPQRRRRRLTTRSKTLSRKKPRLTLKPRVKPKRPQMPPELHLKKPRRSSTTTRTRPTTPARS